MNAPDTCATTATSRLSPDALNAWFDASRPWQSGFFALLRAIAAREPCMPLPGTASLPREEPYRIGQLPSMAFAPREIAALSARDGRLDVKLFGLGLWGPQGPLPLHMTETAYSRMESLRDGTLADFTDLFHHRALSLFYRAWASAQSTASLDRPHNETFSFYVASLIGTDVREAGRSCLATHPRYSAAAHLVREARNPDGLATSLAHYFGVPMAVEEFVFQWIALDAHGQTRLGRPGPTGVVSEGAVLGEAIADCQHKFKLVVGPLDLAPYLRLTPHGADLSTLVEWVRAFVGFEYAWEVKLLIKPHAVPPARADESQRLGYSTWLGEPMDDKPVVGMVFEPEHYYDGQEASRR